MIEIKKCEVNKDKMNISIVGNAEDIAKEYAALTLELRNEYRPVFDRAMHYVVSVIVDK